MLSPYKYPHTSLISMLAFAFAKLILFSSGWLVAWLPVAVPIAKRTQWKPFQPFTPEQKLPLVCSLYLFAPLAVWVSSRIEGVSLASFGVSWQPEVLVSFAIGLAIALAGMVISYGIQVVIGAIALKRPENWIAIAFPRLGIALWIGAIEELVFRGYVFAELGGTVVAAILASIIFALGHLVWDGRNALEQLPGLTLMGLVLCLACVADGGGLGLAWGLHAGWVWAIAFLDTGDALHYTDNIPQWVTGAPGKPLAGLAGILVLLLTAAAIAPRVL